MPIFLERVANLCSAHVVQGIYPEALMELWDIYDQEHDSENDRPARYSSEQLYCVIGLEHGGVTLENIVLVSWSQAVEIFEQVTHALARGETQHQFEVR